MSKPKVQILISLMDNGEVNVSGPLHDKILAYGLLHVAMEIVASPKPAEQQPKLITPAQIIPNRIG